MQLNEQTVCTAFEGYRRIASGAPAEVVTAARRVLDAGESAPVLIFDDLTGEQIDIDYSGTEEAMLAKLAARMREPHPSPGPVPEEAGGHRGPGRPRLGVEAHEVTLLPRHWRWLNEQPGGASVTLRKLVEQARKANEGKDRIRRAREATYGFMNALAGNLDWFEEATRALFAGNRERFMECTETWPGDVRGFARRLAESGFEETDVQA